MIAGLDQLSPVQGELLVLAGRNRKSELLFLLSFGFPFLKAEPHYATGPKEVFACLLGLLRVKSKIIFETSKILFPSFSEGHAGSNNNTLKSVLLLLCWRGSSERKVGLGLGFVIRWFLPKWSRWFAIRGRTF